MKQYIKTSIQAAIFIFGYSCCIAFGAESDSLQVDGNSIEKTYDQEESFDDLPTETQEKETSTKGDTTYISFGKKKVRIIERDGQTDVKIADKDEDEAVDWDSDEDCKDLFSDMEDDNDGKFKGHWAGLELGLSNYVDKSGSFNRNYNDGDGFMDIRTGRSWNINLNFAQQSLGFGSDRIGLVTGMGLEWSNYHFTDTNSIAKVDGQIAPTQIPESTTKNRFQTTYLTVPLILEWQFAGDKKEDRSYIGVGVIGGVNLFANTLIKYVEDGDKKKEKNKGGYNLAPVRYALTARMGFKALKFYANYHPVALFQKGKGPELYPVSAGLVMSF